MKARDREMDLHSKRRKRGKGEKEERRKKNILHKPREECFKKEEVVNRVECW